MTDSSLVETELCSTRQALKKAIPEDYNIYQKLLESFLCGKLTKEELEGSLRSILNDSIANYDLHNKYVGLVLEKLSIVESNAMTSLEVLENHKESISISLDTIEFTFNDQQYFTETLQRPLVALEDDIVVDDDDVPLAGLN